MRDPAMMPGGPEPDVREALDRELAALPEVYRVAVVVCYLEGLGRREAAERLGWSEGTLSGRLARARALLARRLARYGPAVPAGALGLISPEGIAAGLAEATVRVGVLMAAGEAVVAAPVAALSQGVMKAMLLTKLKGMAVAAVAGCAVLVTAAAGWRAEAGARQDRPATGTAADAPKKAQKTDRDRIRLNLGVNVSTRDLSTGTNIGGGVAAGLNTRNVNTTVELRPGTAAVVAWCSEGATM